MSTPQSVLDNPIREVAQDQLDREPFAHLVADALLRANEEAATVLGLTGAWGTGKSSVANLVVGIVADRATVVRFEPWMIGTREALVREFVVALGKAILPKDDSKQAKEARARFYRYGARILGIVEAGAGIVGSVVPGVSIFSKAASPIGKLLKQSAEALEDQAKEPSLDEVKTKIASDLREIEKPVVVIIDDIDRLPHDEIRTILQLVKACADFPNVRYLLLYDRVQVVAALEDSVSDPEAFLEKIIGQAYDLPDATEMQRIAILDQALDELGLDRDLDAESLKRLGSTFSQVLLPGLTTVRQVKRYIATVRSLLPGVTQDGLLNVDPADFLALEFIRQYAPGLYTMLRNEVAPQPGGPFPRFFEPKERGEQLNAERKAQLDDLPSALKKAASTALRQLIGVVEGHGIRRRLYISDYWRPVYLGFHGARAAVSEKKWQNFLAAIDNPYSDHDWLAQWSDRKLRDEWVTTIISRVLDIEKWSRARRFLEMILQWGEQHKPESPAIFSGHQSWESSVSHCVTAVMQAVPSNIDPVQEFEYIIKSSNSVVAAGYAIDKENRKTKNHSSDLWSDGHDIQPLILLLREPFRVMLTENTIWDFPDVGVAMQTALSLYGQEFAEEWYNSIPQDKPLLVQYFDRHLGELESFHINFEGNPWIEAIQALDPADLTTKGRQARKRALESSMGLRDDVRPRLENDLER